MAGKLIHGIHIAYFKGILRAKIFHWPGARSMPKDAVRFVGTIEWSCSYKGRDVTITILLIGLLIITVVGFLFFAQMVSGLRQELTRSKETLLSLDAYSKSRQDMEKQTADSIKRVENILAGAGTKGSAGENIVEFAFSKFPPDWQVRNLAIANKIVEFGVRLPDNLILPIDSKWAATDLVEKFLECQDVDARQRLKARIHSVTEKRALEIQKYLDPNITTSFGLAVVPDPLFEICAEIVPTLSQQNVMLVSYSMFIPYILLIFHMTLKSAHTIDLRRLDAFVKTATESVLSLQGELQGRLSKATVLLNNVKTDMESQLGKLNMSLAALQVLKLPEQQPSEHAEPPQGMQAGV
jgi:DNA recombination protein RmuC